MRKPPSALALLSALLLALLLVGCSPVPEWNKVGPFEGGRLSAIVASPADENVLVVGSPGGGVWLTKDNGATWRNISFMYDPNIMRLEWDIIRPDTLYAVTPAAVFANSDLMSTNPGWTMRAGFGDLYPPLYPEKPLGIMNPMPFEQLQLGDNQSVILFGRRCSGLYYSYDGQNFQQLLIDPNDPSSHKNCIVSVGADPVSKHVYVHTLPEPGHFWTHVFRSATPWSATSQPTAWDSAHTGLPDQGGVSDFAWISLTNQLAAFVADSGSSRLYFLMPDGTWTPSPGEFPGQSWGPRPLLYGGANQLFAGAVIGYQTTDFGQTWQEWHYSSSAGGLDTQEHVDTRAIYAHTYEEPARSFLWKTNDGYTSHHGGNTIRENISRWSWNPGQNQPVTQGSTIPVQGLMAWQPHAILGVRDPDDSLRIFSGAIDNGGLCRDSGQPWVREGVPSGGAGGGDVWSVVAAPTNPDRAYSRGNSSTSFGRSDNAGSATTCSAVGWQDIAPAGGVMAPIVALNSMTAVHPNDEDKVVFARFYDVAISDDGGQTLAASELPDRALPVTVFVDASNIYVGTVDSGVFQTSDNGVTWQPFALNTTSPRMVMKIAFTPENGGTWLLGTTDGLYTKVSSGAWTHVPVGEPGEVVSEVEVDPQCAKRIVLGTGFASDYGQQPGHVFLSDDAGTTWTKQPSHGGAPVSDIFLPFTGDEATMLVATYGNSVLSRTLPARPCQ